MDELNEIMTDTVTDDLEEVCPKIEHVKKKPWKDGKLQNLGKRLKTLKDPEEARNKQNKLKKVKNELKNKNFAELVETSTLHL